MQSADETSAPHVERGRPRPRALLLRIPSVRRTRWGADVSSASGCSANSKCADEASALHLGERGGERTPSSASGALANSMCADEASALHLGERGGARTSSSASGAHANTIKKDGRKAVPLSLMRSFVN